MIFVFFSCINPNGEARECSYGGPTVESCFDTLNYLTAIGWQLVNVKLVDAPGSGEVKLPIEAFTGESMETHLLSLQQTWETVLAQPYCVSPQKGRCAFVQKQHVTKVIRHTLQTQGCISEQREARKRRIESLFKKADSLQLRIQETKAKWGVV